jgi:hypothetical protein
VKKTAKTDFEFRTPMSTTANHATTSIAAYFHTINNYVWKF